MSTGKGARHESGWPKLSLLPLPAKALISAVILTMAIAMIGALGQIIVHDIIPTFFAEGQVAKHSVHEMESSALPEAGEGMGERGDLFASTPKQVKRVEPFYKTEQFVWTLKWTHIHLFGMNMIFIFLGAVTLFLDLSARARAWLIVLPFAGVLIDIASMWLKGYVSPAFFWLHIPGGGIFGVVFLFVSIRAFWEMWWSHSTA